MKFLKEIDVRGKCVFVRNDLNVPLDKKQNIMDDTRIRASCPTLEYLIEQGARIITASHLGRPGGRKRPEFSLKPAADRLSELLDRPVLFNGETVGKKVEEVKAKMKPGDIFLLENLRFHSEENSNDPLFAQELAQDVDVYVNNAFGVAHRNHASVVAITQFVPQSVAGLLVKNEIDYLRLALEKPSEKYVLILGGAKVSDKIPVINNLINRSHTILIGGAMAYTFLAARGVKVGSSRVEKEHIPTCQDILNRAEQKGVTIVLPVDHVAAVKIEPNVTIRMVERGKQIPDEMMGLDIGTETVEQFVSEIHRATLIVWNGPMGVFEVDDFSAGTTAVARAVAESQATSIVGGGDSVLALHKAGVADQITHISTGGGASLEYLSGKILPGIAALS